MLFVSMSGGIGTGSLLAIKILFLHQNGMVIRVYRRDSLEVDYQVVAKFEVMSRRSSQNDFTVAVMTTRPVPNGRFG